MVKVTRSNPQVFEQLKTRLKDLDGQVAKAGWFESARYENGLPVAVIAAQNEFGVTLNHPGGTPYRIGADGRAVFVSKAEGAGLPVTKPHQIVIPPRPFMRPTSERDKPQWLRIVADGANAIMRGATTGKAVMLGLGSFAAGGIAKSISEVFSPPLKASTIAARRRALTDNKTIGLLDKPLVASGIMLNTVTNTVESDDGSPS